MTKRLIIRINIRMETDLDRLLVVFDAFVNATGRAEATVSAQFFGRGGRIKDLRAGGDMGSRTIADVMKEFSRRWPNDLDWPEGIARPEPAPSEAPPVPCS